MKELVVLGFTSRELAEKARSLGAELDREGALNLDGVALAYRRHERLLAAFTETAPQPGSTLQSPPASE